MGDDLTAHVTANRARGSLLYGTLFRIFHAHSAPFISMFMFTSLDSYISHDL